MYNLELLFYWQINAWRTWQMKCQQKQDYIKQKWIKMFWQMYNNDTVGLLWCYDYIILYIFTMCTFESHCKYNNNNNKEHNPPIVWLSFSTPWLHPLYRPDSPEPTDYLHRRCFKSCDIVSHSSSQSCNHVTVILFLQGGWQAGLCCGGAQVERLLLWHCSVIMYLLEENSECRVIP